MVGAGFQQVMRKAIDFSTVENVILSSSHLNIAVLVFAGFPAVALLHEHAESLWLLALKLFNGSSSSHQAAMATTMEEIKKHDDDLELDYCMVCLSQLVSHSERYRVLHKCNHKFHVHCIDAWLIVHSTCPLCRRTIPHTPLQQYPKEHQQDRYFYGGGLLPYFVSLFENTCSWLVNPLNPELMSSLSQHCQQLPA